jgi:hypothetical protein
MKKSIVKTIKDRAKVIGLQFDADSYVAKPEDNLISPFGNWNEIQSELGKGNGSELKVKNGKQKFCALCSSACLCVNNFAEIKKLGEKVDFLGIGRFNNIKFEGKVDTGISKPNLDVLLENDEYVCGLESKFTEIYTEKLPNHVSNGKPNLSNYKNRVSELNNLPPDFEKDILDYYIVKKDKMYLDVAQLIKHSLGLINDSKKKNKKPILIYIFWEPKEQLIEKEIHRSEVVEFWEKISPKFITFKYFTYEEFWNYYDNNSLLKEIIEANRKRYSI